MRGRPVESLKVERSDFPLERARGPARKRGFSLVEVLVALAILTIGIAGLVPMLAFNVRSNHFSKAVGLANYIADEHLEKARSWPVYENTVVDSVTRQGIVAGNTSLFGTWALAAPGHPDETFTVASELYHNGYTLGNCQGGATFGGTSGSPVVGEGNFLRTYARTWPDGSLNDGIIADCGGSGYRGEDFKVVRVTVSWNDPFSQYAQTHSIQRQVYIAKF